jgi:chromosome segregation ATPase
MTVEEYEGYKKKLAEAQKEITTLEAKESQLAELLMSAYGLTPDDAKQELARLEKELPQMEAQFEAAYQEFCMKYQAICA